MAKPKEPKEVRHHVKAWRKHRHLTQERLAERVERSRGLISQIESGETELTEQMIYALADALGCEPGELLTMDPGKEGKVVDLMALLRNADPEIRKDILEYAVFRLGRTGTDG